MKNSIIFLAALILILTTSLSGCIFPGDRWGRDGGHGGDRGHDRGGDRGHDRGGDRGYGSDRNR